MGARTLGLARWNKDKVGMWLKNQRRLWRTHCAFSRGLLCVRLSIGQRTFKFTLDEQRMGCERRALNYQKWDAPQRGDSLKQIGTLSYLIRPSLFFTDEDCTDTALTELRLCSARVMKR